MREAPNMLILKVDGTLVCRDGKSVKSYLKKFMKERNMREDIPICVIHREGLNGLYNDSYMARSWGA